MSVIPFDLDGVASNGFDLYWLHVFAHLRRIESVFARPFVDAMCAGAGHPKLTHRINAFVSVGPANREFVFTGLADFGRSRSVIHDGQEYADVGALSAEFLWSDMNRGSSQILGVSFATSNVGSFTTIRFSHFYFSFFERGLFMSHEQRFSKGAIAILGGTGDQGFGLALRLAKAGRKVLIGSRQAERAVKAAEEARALVPTADVTGFDNAAAAAQAEIVVLSVPFEHTASTVKGLKDALKPGQVFISMVVPLASSVGGAASQMVQVWQGSAAELVESLLPENVSVVSAFQNVSAAHLRDLAHEVDADVIVSGAKDARAVVMDLCALVPGLRAIDGGPLANARIVESITALMIGINIRYKIPAGVGLRFTGLPK